MSDLERVVSERRWWTTLFFFWYLPYDAIVEAITNRYNKVNPSWAPDRFAEWTHKDLVWRICFLQGAGRSAWIEKKLWQTRILPVAMFLAAIGGYLLGARR